MKENLTILSAAEALEKEDFSFVNDENIKLLQKRLSCFCEESYKEYEVLISDQGFVRCLNDRPMTFKALVIMAEKMPSLLRNDDLREFLGYMYQKPGTYFKGMLSVMQACETSNHYLSAFSKLHIAQPEVRNWIKSHWDFCYSYRKEIFAEMKRHEIFDASLSILCKPYRFFAPMYAVYFFAGVFVGVLVEFLYLVFKLL